MARFKKQPEQLGYRTPEFIREKSSVPRIPVRLQRVRYTQHKG